MRKLFRGIGYVIAALLYSVGLLKPEASQARSALSATLAGLSSTPDLPSPFGYKTVWFAVRTEDISAVADAFDLRSRHVANWSSGMRFSYDFDRQFSEPEKPVFISPPVNGWTLVLGGLSFSADSQERIGGIRRRLCELSNRFGEAQYFGSYRVVGYVAWYKASNGEVERGLSLADGTVFANEGATSQAELDIGCFDMSGMDEGEVLDRIFEEEDFSLFDEESPMKIAEIWSVNPLSLPLDGEAEPATGIAGLCLD